MRLGKNEKMKWQNSRRILHTMSARIRILIVLCLSLFVAIVCPVRADTIQQPSPPTDGPGGAQAPHASVIRNVYGQGGTQYWIYEPDAPKPARAPVVVFIHGWSAMNPAIYGAWIDHIVKRGNIVIFPLYQATMLTSPRDFTPNAVSSVQDALKRLQSEPDHVKPELDHFAAVGHSVGGLLVANLAALAKESELPQVKAVMSTEPGKTRTGDGETFVPLADMSNIPASTLLLAIAGDQDKLVSTTDALRIFHESINVAPENKNYVLVHSDSHGLPPLAASHLAPVAPDLSYNSATNFPATRPYLRNPGMMIDALDYYGYWKLFDGLCDAAFNGTHREYALGNSPEQRFMGKWSDGTAVKELEITLGTAGTAAQAK
jgi:acetyl esterase/lipase